MLCFNPYFTGSNSGRLLFFPLISFNCLVSILILLEVILEEYNCNRRDNSVCSFNPYFTGSNSGRINASFSNIYRFTVSILILLEVILEGNAHELAWLMVFSFNPYFTGSNSGRACPLLLDRKLLKFQSLFYWK